MTKEIVIESLDERNLVRSVYKTAHCRPVEHSKGYYVFYTDKKKNKIILGFDLLTRAGAWRSAAQQISNGVVKKLES